MYVVGYMYAACTHMGVGIHVYAYSQRPKGDPGCLLILIATLIPPKTGSVTGYEAQLMSSSAPVSFPHSTGFMCVCVCVCVCVWSHLLSFLGSEIHVLTPAQAVLLPAEPSLQPQE